MKRKLLALLLVAMMLIGTIGCTATETPATTTTDETATEAPAEAAATEEAVVEETDPFQAKIDEILASATESSLADVLDAGVVTIGVEGNWTPYIYYDPDNPDNLIGFHVEVAEAIAAKLGITCEFDVASQFDGILAGLQAGRFQVISMGLKNSTIKDYPDLTNTIFYNQDMPVIIVNSENTDIVDIASMNGKKAGNSTTSSYGKIAYNAGCDCNPDLDFAMAMMGITNGTIDLAVNSYVVFSQYMEQYPDAPLKIAFYYEPENIEDLQGGVTLRTADQSLIDAFNVAIEELLNDGTIIELARKYLGDGFVENAALYQSYLNQ